MWLVHRLEEFSKGLKGEKQSNSEVSGQLIEKDDKPRILLGQVLGNTRKLVGRLPAFMSPKSHHPNRQKLSSVQDFFLYTEAEGKKLFSELDRDGDGQVTLEDLEVVMHKRRLPPHYARAVLKRLRKNWLLKSFGWPEFQELMERREPAMLRAFTSLNLSPSGTLHKAQVLKSLRRAGLAATEENASAMMRFLGADSDDGQIAYGQFRSFMLLLPPERVGDDPSMLWFQAATVVPLATPAVAPTGSVLKSALAGGMACGLSTTIMHPLDTVKTRVQVSTKTMAQVFSEVPQIGARGLYRGAIPAIVGQFSSHGLRTGAYEASKIILHNIAPDLPDVQVQSLASFCSSLLGTGLRIPCEVVKQRLQAGMYSNLGDAVVQTYRENGLPGFFRGTAATMCREVPFYVAGMVIYEEAKKGLRGVLDRELKPWETLAVGALAGGTAAVCTTPADVLKTRLMTAAPGIATSMSAIAMRTVQQEGLQALFKGAVPRFFWIAPLGAMNFAGYELAKRALEKREREAAAATRRGGRVMHADQPLLGEEGRTAGGGGVSKNAAAGAVAKAGLIVAVGKKGEQGRTPSAGKSRPSKDGVVVDKERGNNTTTTSGSSMEKSLNEDGGGSEQKGEGIVSGGGVGGVLLERTKQVIGAGVGVGEEMLVGTTTKWRGTLESMVEKVGAVKGSLVGISSNTDGSTKHRQPAASGGDDDTTLGKAVSRVRESSLEERAAAGKLDDGGRETTTVVAAGKSLGTSEESRPAR